MDAELEPNDMLDFIWLTLKPAAQKEILETRSELGEDGVSPTTANDSPAQQEAA